jgi:hypothetical protein
MTRFSLLLAPNVLSSSLRVVSTLAALAVFAGCRTAEVKLEDTSGSGDLDSVDSTDSNDSGDSSDSTDSSDTDVITSGDISVSPSSIDLPVLFIGQSVSADLKITNIGDGPVAVTMSFAGAWATSYTLDSYTAVPEPGAESAHTLTLTPTTWGDHSVGLIIDADTGAHIEVPVRAQVQEDADGDGFGSVISGGEDCDDTNPEINPGAPDAWYDGIDSDCAGNDDYDQDADGSESVDYGGDDCDDTEDSTNPAATDLWYDGIDSDCAGNDDYDQDADGYVMDVYAGLPTLGVPTSGALPDGDCDDTDASLNPGMTDTWYDGIDSDCAENDDYDKDGDGHQSDLYGGDDCNDTNVTIYTGATDAWYDGTDSDCAGNDDYDQDYDGARTDAAGGDDCDDTDANIGPAMTDTWYDGVDTDCAGNDDYDQDYDAYVPDEYGGLATVGVAGSGALPDGDCDDTDAAFHPGAADTWYDGIDNDCAGNDDYDQDRDGHQSDDYGGDDCNDAVASTYPGAADAWYDGVDSDCAGNDDYDQDGDGVDYPTDCNDTDATVTGPVAETLNGIDDDCDGYTDDFAVGDLASGAIYGYSSSMGLGEHGTLALTNDVTGDGKVDLLVGTRTSSNGYVWVLDGATSAAANGSVANYDTAVISGDSGYYPIYAVNGPWADEDGDGVTDFIIGGAYGSTYGRSYLFEGGSSITGSFSSSTYDVRIDGDDYYSYSDNASMSCIADVDGDGVGDIIVGASGDDYGYWWGAYYQLGSVSVFLDGSWSGSVDIGDADERIYGEDEYDYLGYSLTAADLDADGYDDFVVGAPGYDGASSGDGGVFIVNGNASGSWSSQIEGAADGYVYGGSSGVALGTDTLAHPGDLDGDGKLDLALSSEDKGYVWVFLDAGSIVDNTAASTADYILTGTAGDFGSMIVSDSDLDDDGKDDLVIGSDGADTAGSNYGAVYIYLDVSGWTASMTSSNASVTVWGSSSNGYLGTGGAGGEDMDGDGIEDLAIGSSANDAAATDAGAVFVVPGW